MATRKTDAPRLFLASNSPRRRELMAVTGWEYGILSAQVDETPLNGEGGTQYVQRLADHKLSAAANQAPDGSVTIAADTTVIDGQANGSSILGKPHNQEEAAQMLHTLRGRTHQVHTAIAILDKRDGSQLSDLCTTDVPMRSYSDDEIEAYVSSGDPMDKAGAYAIQHAGFHPVERMEGCFANVMGLPLCHLTRSLLKLGLTPRTDVPRACQAALGYRCLVFQIILDG